MYNYRNPCYCSSVINENYVKSTCDGECIHVPHMLIIGEESIGPCGEIKSVLWDKCLDICTCEKNGKDVTYEVYSSYNLTVNNINEIGIEVESNGGDSTDNYGKVEFIVRCGRLSSMGTLTVVFKNLCKDVKCSDGQKCDKCTGGCVAIGADLDVT